MVAPEAGAVTAPSVGRVASSPGRDRCAAGLLGDSSSLLSCSFMSVNESTM